MTITIQSISLCKEVVQDILSKLEITAGINVRATDEMIGIEIDSEEHSKELIGYRGETLSALQTIVSLILSKRIGERVYVIIDVNGYRERREQTLTKLAKRAAEEVMVAGKPMTLDPMQAFERRIVHLVLKSYPQVETESMGEDPDRRIVIRPHVDVAPGE